MQDLGSYLLPCLIAAIVLFGLFKRLNVFELFLEGAAEGLKSALKILPSLVGLVTAVSMLNASGALDSLTAAIKPVTTFLGIPEELLPLALLRPISGGGALAIFEGILKSDGPDSPVGRIASVMMGSSETTFYCISLYFGSIGIRKTRHTVPAALAADLTCFIMSLLLVRLFY